MVRNTVFKHLLPVRKLIPAFLILIITCSGCRKSLSSEPTFSDIESGFKNIPDTVQTSIYWYWLSDNISREGVVKDLEAMKKVGINRAFIGNIGLNNLPPGKVKIFSDEWWDILHTALKKATELNIEIGIFNSPGWSQSGGPWIKPEQSMRYLNSSEIHVSGPQQLDMKLNTPTADFQRVRVIAFRTPSLSERKFTSLNPAITSNPGMDIKNCTDGDTSTFILLQENHDLIIDINFPQPFNIKSLIIQTARMPIRTKAMLYVKTDSGYTMLKDFEINRTNPGLTVGFDPYAPVVISVPETESKGFRLEFGAADPSGGIAEIDLSSFPKVERYPEKSLAKMFQSPLPYWNDYMWPVQPEFEDQSLALNPQDVMDITKMVSPDGVLEWNVPDGKWTIMQTGMTTTGVVNEPASPEGTGLEADKLSKKHIAYHFDSFLGEILRRIPAEDRKSWKVVVEDSYERGGQNWTDGFAEDFTARYGYDPVKYIPVLSGYVVGSRAVSDRFLWDLRRLVADKIARDYVGGLREVSHKNGLTTWLENYGHWGFPAEFLQYGGQSDEVGGEFWSEGKLGNIENRAASSCAHIYGKKKVSAESFTCGGAPFSRYPAKLKQRGDRFFTEGINNTLLHVYIHQPAETTPGMNAWFGNEFNRHNTWFGQMDLFIQYLKRVNYMLQKGNYVADVAYFIGEDVPKMTGVCNPTLPVGYSFDYINSEVIMNRLSVKDGRLILPDGMSYRILVLPELTNMRPELLKKITQLVKEGAVVLGPAPDHSPSLENFPQCDQQVKQMASDLWGEVDGIKLKSAGAGKGMIMSGMQLQEALDMTGTVPDCNSGVEGDPFLFIHRELAEGDIYFISNQSDSTIFINPEFRITGKIPELWDAVTGSVRDLPQFSLGKETTVVPLKLEAFESAFIIFRKSNPREEKINSGFNYPEPRIVAELTDPWYVTFDTASRGPSKPVVFNTLYDWTASSNDSIRYYSGTASYKSEFTLEKSSAGRKLYVGLGSVNGMAKVSINGKYAGGAWTAPWKVEISALVREGENRIEVEIVNTWVNRLIGDSKLIADKRKTWCLVNPFKPDSPLAPSGMTGPVQIFYNEN
jgi:hypothetical protein